MAKQRPRLQRATIKDVARVANVSVSTVSNVLNGRTDAMTPETLHRVREAIKKLDYRPSSAARALVTKRMATIGLVLAEIETPLFLQALHRIEPVARSAGYNALLSIARSTEDEREALNLLLDKQVEGVIFLSNSSYVNDEHLQQLLRARLPAVLVNRANAHADFDQVNWDNTGGVVSAVDHLVALGHRRIAFLHGPIVRRSSAERLTGYRQALAKHGISPREDYVQPGDFTAPRSQWWQSSLALLRLPERPTAIIAADDTVAAAVMKAAQSIGLGVPQDVSVIGIDDQPFCVDLNPALTTVRLPVIEAGGRAVEMLLGRIAGKRQTCEHILLPCPLVLRDSCGAAPHV